MYSKCKCPFSESAKLLRGSHHDPISSEKSWLDFAVRELSREAADKSRGQEAVWQSHCKPSWWDSACPHPWKNPTANPKDSKDTLNAKFQCLVQHLRKEGKLPREMEEEITLWESGKIQEMFLMTSFSSLLGQTSNLHTVLDETFHKMEDGGVSVDDSILNSLHTCLSVCMKRVDSMRHISQKNRSCKSSEFATEKANKSGRKRNRSEAETGLSEPSKKLKHCSVNSSASLASCPSRALILPSSSLSSAFAVSAANTPPQLKSDSNMALSQCVEPKLVLTLLHKKLKNKASDAAALLSTSASCQSAQNKNQALFSMESTAVADTNAFSSSHCNESENGEQTQMVDFFDIDSVAIEDIIDVGVFDQVNSPVHAKSECLDSMAQSVGSPASSIVSPDSCHIISPFRNSCHYEDLASALADSCEAGTVSDTSVTLYSPDDGEDSFSEIQILNDSGYDTSDQGSDKSFLDNVLISPELEAFLDSFYYNEKSNK